MVGSSKILTVSYGTFSCTLEGFDDSFGTMKAIAEYFRDLAADDRYFGAEPPVPDAQMLARIAEREVARRVEARLDGTGVTLRTGDALPQQVAAVVQAAPGLAQAPAQTVASPAPKPVMRQVISQTEATDLAPNATPAMPPVAVAPIPPVQQMMTANTPVFVPAPPRVAPVQTTRPAVRQSEVPVVAEPAIPFVIPAHPDADSVAAKLQRIRAVVGRATVTAAPQEYAEDLGDMSAMSDASDQSLSETVTLHSLSEQWAELEDTADADLDAANNPDEPDTAFDMTAVTAALDTSETQSIAETAATPLRARVIRVRRADFDAAATPAALEEPVQDLQASDAASQDLTVDDGFVDLDDLSEMDQLSDLLALDGVAGDMALSDMSLPEAEDTQTDQTNLGDGTLPPDAEADLLEELAALERDAILADDYQSFTATEDAEIDIIIEDDLTEDADFSMANVLAASADEVAVPALPQPEIDAADVAALFDLPPGDDAVFDFSTLSDTDTPAEAEAEVTPLRLGRDLLEREPEADAEAMDRIMSQTDAELNSPENSRRREAIAQLKAAVAATEAARLLGEKSADADIDEVESAFRDDLKQVVRPRRPMAEVNSDLRSERPRPAPLKLVASQRIDIPQPRPVAKPVMPVRPRRVSVQDDQVIAASVAPQPMAGSFAEFAANMGATELPDLLEAAAAYTSFVEGVEDFSRPQLMKKVQDMAAEDYSREDGLRSFGTLLRQGRIMKTANGRFIVNEGTRFNPERKSA